MGPSVVEPCPFRRFPFFDAGRQGEQNDHQNKKCFHGSGYHSYARGLLIRLSPPHSPRLCLRAEPPLSLGRAGLGPIIPLPHRVLSLTTAWDAIRFDHSAHRIRQHDGRELSELTGRRRGPREQNPRRRCRSCAPAIRAAQHERAGRADDGGKHGRLYRRPARF